MLRGNSLTNLGDELSCTQIRRPAQKLLPSNRPVQPDEAAVATETASIVQTAVARLPEQQRMVVVLRTWNGLSYRAIAQIMERAESTVRSEMFHGLAAMRKYLEPRLR